MLLLHGMYLCDTFISIGDCRSSISCCYHSIDIFSLKFCLFRASSKARSAPIAAPSTCWQNDSCHDFSIFIQNNNVCTCRSAVDSCKISFSHFFSPLSKLSIFMLSANASNLVSNCPLLCTV